MKITYFVLFSLFLMIGCTNNPDNANQSSVTEKLEKVDNQLRHVVLFKFKESSSEMDIQKVEASFNALKQTITEIKDFEWGTNNSPEKLNKGFTHCYFLTFDSEKDRDAYLVHPDHKAFGDVIGPHLEDVLVVDYWAK